MSSILRRYGVGIFLAVVAALFAVSPANAIDTGFRYEINPQHNFGMCLDVRGAGTANLTRVVQFQCTGGTNQQFVFNRVSGNIYEIRPVHSQPFNKCLDVQGPSTADGAFLQIFTCNGQTNQQFQLLDDSPFAGATSRIRSVFSSKCLDVRGSSNENGADVVQFTCHGGANQRFDLIAH